MKTLSTLLLFLFISLLYMVDQADAQSERQPLRHSADIQEAVKQKVETRTKAPELRVMRHLNRFQKASNGSQASLMSDDLLLEQAVLQFNFGDENEEPEWIDFMRTKYSWQQNRISEMLFQSTFFSDGWINTNRYSYEYTGEQLTMFSNFFWVDETGWVADFTQELIYELINGVPYIHEVHMNEYGEPYMRAEISYNGTDIQQIEEFMPDGSGGWELIGRSVFEYDGTNLTETYSADFGDGFEPQDRIIYFGISPADFYEFITAETEIIFINSQTIMYLQFDFPDMLEQVWDGNDWVNEYRLERTEENQPDGEVFSSLTFTFFFYDTFGEVWEPEDRFFIAFNEMDQILYGDLYYFDDWDEEWLLYDRELFTYDSNGVPVSIRLVEYDDWDEVYYDYGRLLLTWGMTNVSIGDGSTQLPVTVRLGNAYPNPFNPTTNIPFEINQSSHVNLQIYDMLGRRVAGLVNENMAAGAYAISFDASRLSSGVYIVRLQAGNEIKTNRITLIK